MIGYHWIHPRLGEMGEIKDAKFHIHKMNSSDKLFMEGQHIQTYNSNSSSTCFLTTRQRWWRIHPKRSLHWLPPPTPPSWVFLLLSVLGLLPVLLFEKDPNAVFCRTPVGDDPSDELLSHPSVIRFSIDEFFDSPLLLFVLWRTSPSGPPMELSHEMGIQFACLLFASSITFPTPNPIWIGSNSREDLNGERVSFSWTGDDVEDLKSDVAIGIDMDSWVLSDWRSGFQFDHDTDELSDWFLGQLSECWVSAACWEVVRPSEGLKAL